MAGRPRKPDQIKAAQGNPGRRRLVDRDPPPETSRKIAIPPQLGPEAIAVWRRLAPELQLVNLMRATDVEPFARYCQLVVEYWKLSAEIDGQGHRYETESKHGKLWRMNPTFAARNLIARRLEALESGFGLTPRARQEIMARLAASPPGLPFDTPAETRSNRIGTPEPPAPSPIGILGTRVH
jgi:P27 family predicted phage terminase small subunit